MLPSTQYGEKHKMTINIKNKNLDYRVIGYQWCAKGRTVISHRK